MLSACYEWEYKQRVANAERNYRLYQAGQPRQPLTIASVVRRLLAWCGRLTIHGPHLARFEHGKGNL
ncbi:MAG: hypothetical protein DYG89_17105 [Caldilinea sp. CFX5]|nr:hypothetical protein [Caldilinea sp. CFX5]